MIAFSDPLATRAAIWWARAMPPLWQYFLRVRRARRVHCGPQRARTPGPFGVSPANQPFLGDRRKGP